jgi:CDP-diacylglycerol--glycerol-3-phosphate 3-phosphatidyltransferase
VYFGSSPQLANYCVSFLEVFQKLSYDLLPSSMTWANAVVKHGGIRKLGKTAIHDLQVSSKSVTPPEAAAFNEDEDVTLIFPIIQAGLFDIREEEECLRDVFLNISASPKSAGVQPLVDLTSGYFGLYKLYQEAVIWTDADYRVMAASPEACRHQDLIDDF